MALVRSLLGRRKSAGMDGGHLEGQHSGMFVFVFIQGIRSVGWFTGRLAFMLSVATEADVSHLVY